MAMDWWEEIQEEGDRSGCRREYNKFNDMDDDDDDDDDDEIGS